MNIHAAALSIVVLFAAIAAYTDVRTRRIPNAIPAALFVIGIGLAALGGVQNIAVNIALGIAVFAIGTCLFSMKLIGGGDVKLLASAAATLGWPNSAAFLLCTILAGGVLGIMIAVARGRLRPVLANLRSMALPMLSGVRPAALPSAAGSMPYGLAILAGAAAVALGEALGLSLRISL